MPRVSQTYEKKRQLSLSLTDSEIAEFKRVAASYGCRNPSDMISRLLSGVIELKPPKYKIKQLPRVEPKEAQIKPVEPQVKDPVDFRLEAAQLASKGAWTRFKSKLQYYCFFGTRKDTEKTYLTLAVELIKRYIALTLEHEGVTVTVPDDLAQWTDARFFELRAELLDTWVAKFKGRIEKVDLNASCVMLMALHETIRDKQLNKMSLIGAPLSLTASVILKRYPTFAQSFVFLGQENCTIPAQTEDNYDDD